MPEIRKHCLWCQEETLHTSPFAAAEPRCVNIHFIGNNVCTNCGAHLAELAGVRKLLREAIGARVRVYCSECAPFCRSPF